MTDEIESPLNDWEWDAPHLCNGRPLIECDICFGQFDRHAQAALALDGQPFGFTKDDVKLLEAAIESVEHDDYYVAEHLGLSDYRGDHREAMIADKYRNLAARLKALIRP